MKKKTIVSILLGLSLTLTGCENINSFMNDVKGNLVGISFEISVYDNFGNNVVDIHGDKVSVNGNTVSVYGKDADGNTTTEKKISSVVTNTIDGNNMEQTGNTVIYAETGLNEIENFELPKDITTSGGKISYFDRNINEIKNMIGTSKVVVISSQLGVPIAVYGGESVYWEIPDDLPKMTKISIDGKALYVHRANYLILDTKMIKQEE